MGSLWSSGRCRIVAIRQSWLPAQKGITRDGLSFSKGQLCDPIGIDLMGGIEVGHTSNCARVEGIDQPASWRPYVITGTEAEACRAGSVVDRLGIRVVDIELNAMTELLLQIGLERIVV